MSDITSGRTEPKKDSAGGLKNAYFVPYIENGFTHANGIVTGLAVGMTEVFKYPLISDENIVKDVLKASKENGTTVAEQEITLALKKVDSATNNQMKFHAWNRSHIVLQDNMDNYSVYGLEDGTNLDDSEKSSGGKKGDFNGYKPKFTAVEKEHAPILDSATVTAFVALVSATNITP